MIPHFVEIKTGTYLNVARICTITVLRIDDAGQVSLSIEDKDRSIYHVTDPNLVQKAASILGVRLLPPST